MNLLSRARIRRFQRTVLEFYEKQRRDFPWRRTRDPYAVLISEMMLQQTRVERVEKFYGKFLKKFPTLAALARAPLKEVLLEWSGLGYNRRALYLKRAAELVRARHGGRLSSRAGELETLPGVGKATAAAVRAYAWNAPVVFVETNIRTVFLRHFFPNRRRVRDDELLKLVARTLPNKVEPFSRFPPASAAEDFGRTGKVQPCSVREWYYALMDYGSFLKKTFGNQNRRSAHYVKQSRFRGSRRQLRGEVLRRVAAGKPITPAEFSSGRFPVVEVMRELAEEGFLRKVGKTFRLA